jgi:hypothetical protein
VQGVVFLSILLSSSQHLPFHPQHHSQDDITGLHSLWHQCCCGKRHIYIINTCI